MKLALGAYRLWIGGGGETGDGIYHNVIYENIARQKDGGQQGVSPHLQDNRIINSLTDEGPVPGIPNKKSNSKPRSNDCHSIV